MSEGVVTRPSQRLRWLGGGAVALASLWLPHKLLVCAGPCLPDLEQRAAGMWSALSMADVRLNAWILAWDHRALLDGSLSLFSSNNFHPAPSMLAASEHLLGVALPLLPLGGWGLDAASVYNIALIASFSLLGLSTYALVLALTGSVLASVLAAAMQMMAPWRLEHLAHLQILSAQWFPLIWLCIVVQVRGRVSWLTSSGLALCATLQLLSSFYLAYMLTLSLVVLGGFLIAWQRPSRAALLRVLAPLTVAYAIFAVSAIPYLARDQAGGFALDVWPSLFPSSVGVMHHLWPPEISPIVAGTAGTSIPLPYVLLPLFAIITSFSARATGEQRSLVAALLSMACLAVVLALGPSRPDFPGASGMSHAVADLFTHVVPGYSLFRVPERWLALAYLSLSVLAGLGIAQLLARTATARATRIVTALCAVFVAAYLPRNVPAATPAYGELTSALDSYADLAALDDGPILELPWATLPAESRYQLASTIHKKPILNGYTGYPPPSYKFLRHLASRLPSREALRSIADMTGLRWVVVHKTEMNPDPWRQLALGGIVEVMIEDDELLILEVPEGDASVRERARGWMDAEVLPPSTFTGTPKSALALTRDEGALSIERIESTEGRHFGRLPVRMRITNRSEWSWPGADYRRVGCVEVVYEYIDVADGEVLLTRTAPILDDIAAASTYDFAFLASPIYALPRRPAYLRVRLAQRSASGYDLLDLEEATAPLPAPQ